MRGRPSNKFSVGLAVFVVLLGGCSEVPEQSSDSAPLLDNFSEELSGTISLTLGDVDYSLEELSQLETKEIQILEPFSKENTNFVGVDFGDLLLDSGFSLEDNVVTIALNDYRYTDTVKNFVDNQALLAFSEGGNPIPVADGGPVRIVFDSDSQYFDNLDAWNWSLRTVERSGGN